MRLTDCFVLAFIDLQVQDGGEIRKVTQKSANAISPAGWSLTQKKNDLKVHQETFEIFFYFFLFLDLTRLLSCFLCLFKAKRDAGSTFQKTDFWIPLWQKSVKPLGIKLKRLHKHSLTNRSCDTKILTCDVSKPLDSIHRNLCVFVCIQSWKIPWKVFYSIQVSWIVWLGLANARAQVVGHKRRVKMTFPRLVRVFLPESVFHPKASPETPGAVSWGERIGAHKTP